MICTKVERQMDVSGGYSAAGIKPSGRLAVVDLVEFDVVHTNILAAVTASDGVNSVPAFGASSGGLVVEDKDAKRNALDPRKWLVTSTFGMPDPAKELAPDALDDDAGSRWKVRITINTVAREKEVQRNIGKKMLLNSAGDPITGITLPLHDEEILITFATNLIFWNTIDDAYDDDGHPKVNSEDVILIVNGEERPFPAGELLWGGYQLGIDVEPTGTFSEMTIRLTRRYGGWRLPVADKGLYIFVGEEDLHQPILDASGRVVTTPQYLDGSGHLLAEGADAIILPDPSDTQPGFVICNEFDMGTEVLWGLHT